MKVLQQFIHFSPENYKLLREKYGDEVMIKTFIGKKIDEFIKKECEEIKQERTLKLLSSEDKL